MMTALRNQASSWVVRALLVLLIATFAVWGIGDVFRGGAPSDVVAEVDGLPIRAVDVRREADVGLAELQRQFGGALPQDGQMRALLTDRALQSAIARRLAEAHARDLGLTVADPTLAERVRDEPAFAGLDGRFERARFDLVLRSSGLDEAAFLADLRTELLWSELVQSITEPAGASNVLLGRLEAWRGERRRGRALIVDERAQTIAAPEESALEAWHEANANRFEAPEYRTAEVVMLSADDLAGEIEVDDAAIAAEYEREAERFLEPERRRVVQLVAADEATARAAAGRIRAGEDLDAVAAAMAPSGVAFADLGTVGRAELPAPLADAVFALAAHALSEPVATAFGWHVARVDEIIPEQVTPLESVRAEISDALKRREAGEQLPELATRLDDLVAGDTPLQAAANETGGRFMRVTIDRAGLERDEKTLAPGLSPTMIDAIFAARQGEVSLVQTEPDGTSYVFMLAEIVPQRLKTLAEARAEIVAAWETTQRREAAKTIAGQLRAQATAGTALEGLAARTPGTRMEAIPLTPRVGDEQDQPLGGAAHASLFATPPGVVAAEIVAVPGGSAVLTTDEVVAVGPADPPRLATAELEREVENDLAASYEAALRGRFAIEVNPATLDALKPAVSN